MLDKHKRFEAMVHGLSSSLYRYAYWLCRDRATAEDLVQETYMRAWRYLDGLRDEKKAKSWLMTTVRREYARQLGRNQVATTDMEPDLIPGPRDVSEADPERSHLRAALSALPEKYREPLVLQVLGGYSGAEIAGMLGLRPATVMTRLFRARQKMRQLLEADTPNGVRVSNL